jgi:protein-L-isoaspartate(D-aspartate) O-methyltransferase
MSDRVPDLIADDSTLDQRRRFYAEEIEMVANIESPRLVAAFARVPRERFLGPGPWQIAGESSLSHNRFRTTDDPRDLYHNVLVVLKAEQGLNNGQPTALASWIAALNLEPGDRVFHVGCGTGYYTAIMAEMIAPNGEVLAVELEPDLAGQAAENLKAYQSVSVQQGDGATIDPGPCDAMLINAGVTHPHLPWLRRLNERGRMVLPLTVTAKPGSGVGVMAGITRAHQHFAADIVSMVGIYSSPSVRDESIESLLRKALESRSLLRLKSVRLDPHQQTANCLVHTPTICLSSDEASSTR